MYSMLQFQMLHINTCISLWTVRKYGLQLPSEITCIGTHHNIMLIMSNFYMPLHASSCAEHFQTNRALYGLPKMNSIKKYYVLRFVLGHSI